MRRTHDFRGALATIPLTVPYKTHGRDPANGIDCIGLILSVYKAAGINIDELDVPYGNQDQKRKDKLPLMVHRLQLRFRELDKTVPQDCHDGDVVVIGKSEDNHLGIIVSGLVVEMTGRRLWMHKLVSVWPFVEMLFRHQQCLHSPVVGV